MLGLIAGEGVGPELIDQCRGILKALQSRYGGKLEVATGPDVSKGWNGQIEDFILSIFGRGGDVLSGPGGGRYVYDARRRLQLNYKVSPIRDLRGGPVDLLVVRHTGSGPFQALEERRGTHLSLSYSLDLEELRQVVRAAQELARPRSGRLTLALKPHGQPLLTQLWREACEGLEVDWDVRETDWLAYQMLKQPESFDVIVAGDEVGDLLSDLGGLLMGGRGMTYGACFNAHGRGIYQTNHGAAYDLAGQDRVNPVGQLSSLAYLLKHRAATTSWGEALEEGLRRALRRARSADLEGDTPVLSTSHWVELLLTEL